MILDRRTLFIFFGVGVGLLSALLGGSPAMNFGIGLTVGLIGISAVTILRGIEKLREEIRKEKKE